MELISNTVGLFVFLFFIRLAQDDNVAEEQGKSNFLTVNT